MDVVVVVMVVVVAVMVVPVVGILSDEHFVLFDTRFMTRAVCY